VIIHDNIYNKQSKFIKICVSQEVSVYKAISVGTKAWRS